jgi:hypothetical protein
MPTRGKEYFHRRDGVIAVELRTGGHATGVVGHHPADRSDSAAGGIRSQDPVIGQKSPIGGADDRARFDPCMESVFQYFDTVEAVPYVNEDVVSLGLAV